MIAARFPGLGNPFMLPIDDYNRFLEIAIEMGERSQSGGSAGSTNHRAAVERAIMRPRRG